MDAKTEQYGEYSISTSFGGRKPIYHDKKFVRPVNSDEAELLIELVFIEMKWDEDERSRYFKSLNVRGLEDWEKIIADMEKDRMILFKEASPVVEKPETEIVALYADGGVIKKNPSEIGGTWAWCAVNAKGERVMEEYGAVRATATRTVSNNHTEQIALTLALEAMPNGWSGTVYSDSQIALGRVFKGWREQNLPANISRRSKAAVARLGKIETVLLQGHPTKEDLKCGIGKKRNLPVSEHNVWCDKACRKAAEEYLEKLKSEE